MTTKQINFVLLGATALVAGLVAFQLGKKSQLKKLAKEVLQTTSPDKKEQFSNMSFNDIRQKWIEWKSSRKGGKL